MFEALYSIVLCSDYPSFFGLTRTSIHGTRGALLGLLFPEPLTEITYCKLGQLWVSMHLF